MTTAAQNSYNDPNATIRRENFAGEAGGGATTEYCKFRSFQKGKLKSVQAVVSTAGTATTHKLDVYHGTTSIGSMAISTAAANTAFSFTPASPGESLAALDQVSVKTGADATGKAHVIFEYVVDQDSLQTV